MNRLACGFKDGTPIVGKGIDTFLALGDYAHGNVDIAPIPAGNNEPCTAGHTSMHGIDAEK